MFLISYLGSQIDGEPILTLPPKRIELKKVEFTQEERDFYCRLEAESCAQFAVCYYNLLYYSCYIYLFILCCIVKALFLTSGFLHYARNMQLLELSNRIMLTYY